MFSALQFTSHLLQMVLTFHVVRVRVRRELWRKSLLYDIYVTARRLTDNLAVKAIFHYAVQLASRSQTSSRTNSRSG